MLLIYYGLTIILAILPIGSAFSSYHLSKSLISSRLHCSASLPISPELPWKSPRYTQEKLEEWWKGKEFSLVTVGAAGLTPSIVNSVKVMMEYHYQLKVKIAHDKIDAWQVSKDLVENEKLEGKIEVLEVRPRMILLGQVRVGKKFVVTPEGEES